MRLQIGGDVCRQITQHLVGTQDVEWLSGAFSGVKLGDSDDGRQGRLAGWALGHAFLLWGRRVEHGLLPFEEVGFDGGGVRGIVVRVDGFYGAHGLNPSGLEPWAVIVGGDAQADGFFQAEFAADGLFMFIASGLEELAHGITSRGL